MTKIKALIIGSLCLVLLGYGAFRVLKPIVRPDARKRLQWMIGSSVPAWNIPAKYWMNTPQPIKADSLKGHVTLIEFFRINCPHCSQEAAPLLKKLHAKYSSRGLKIIAFHAPGKSPNEHDWKQVRTVLEKEWNSPYPVAFDEGGKLFRGKFNGAWYPTILVLDRNLTVKLAQIGLTPESAKQVEKQIQQELAASS